MKILFSPVGMTDPVSPEKHGSEITAVHEGALLQILRHEKPDRVILYYSGETVRHEREDHRYIGGIRLLEQDLGITFAVETIEHPELEDVHLFDGFLVEFRKILEKLRKENPDAEILVNTSSGTPAMKSTLQILAAASALRLKPVQVATWTKSSNHARPCDIQAEWAINADCRPDAENRVTVSAHTNLLYEFNRKVLCGLIDEYDYVAAKLLSQQLAPIISRSFLNLLDAAVLRTNAKFTDAQKKFRECGQEELMPDANPVSEYYLLLCIKAKKQENADLLRMLSPIFTALFERAIQRRFSIRIDDYKDRQGRWDTAKVRGSVLEGKFSPVRRYHQNDRRPSHPIPEVPDGFITTWQLTNLIENLSDPQKDRKLVTATLNLREIEEKVRNAAAHTMVGFTNQEFRQSTGFTALDLVGKLKEYIRQYTSVKTPDTFLEPYQAMNEKLKSYL